MGIHSQLREEINLIIKKTINKIFIDLKLIILSLHKLNKLNIFQKYRMNLVNFAIGSATSSRQEIESLFSKFKFFNS